MLDELITYLRSRFNFGLIDLSRKNIKRPVMLICETVNICNNNCLICGYQLMKRKKEVMRKDVFIKVVEAYAEIGGGSLSLTPMVGEIFLDNNLVDRFRILENYSNITKLSFTTNAVMASNFNDNDLEYILSRLCRIQVSIYGLDEDEYRIMTTKDTYYEFIHQLKRLIRLVDDTSKLRFAFRLLKKHDDDRIRKWMRDNLGAEYLHSVTSKFANWGLLDTTAKLPFSGEWIESRLNDKKCIIPTVALQVFSSGDVSFCACDDFDAEIEFHLGNVKEVSLKKILTTNKYQSLLDLNYLPAYCTRCTFHMPIDNLDANNLIQKDPLEFIGG